HLTLGVNKMYFFEKAIAGIFITSVTSCIVYVDPEEIENLSVEEQMTKCNWIINPCQYTNCDDGNDCTTDSCFFDTVQCIAGCNHNILPQLSHCMTDDNYDGKCWYGECYRSCRTSTFCE